MTLAAMAVNECLARICRTRNRPNRDFAITRVNLAEMEIETVEEGIPLPDLRPLGRRRRRLASAWPSRAERRAMLTKLWSRFRAWLDRKGYWSSSIASSTWTICRTLSSATRSMWSATTDMIGLPPCFARAAVARRSK